MLEVDNISKRYGDVVALDRCTFTARTGAMTGFVGPNGAGKTTTMRAIFGLTATSGGAIRWKGAPVTRADRRRFGYMPEERGLYPKMQLREQIVHFGFIAGMTRVEAGRAADRSMDWLGLADRSDAAIEELSHGNQQRAQLAVALVHDPELLVLDEPFAGLDPLAIDRLGAMLGELASEGRTVLFSSHQLDLVEDLCEDVVTINEGRVVLSGSLREIRQRADTWHLSLEVVGAQPGIFDGVAGVEVVEERDGRVELTAKRGVDLRSIFDRAAEAGEIRRFDYDPPTLSTLFRQAVSA